MKKLATLCVCLLSAAHLLAQINELKRVSPEEMGISTADVTAMLDTLIGDRATSIHSIIVMRKGAVVAEAYPKPFDMEYSHTLYSASKTFVSAAVGIAIAENRLRLTDRVATFFPEFLPDTIGDNLAQMTVRNLLTMSSGIEPDWVMRTITTEWIPTWLRKTINLPGKDFKYDSIDTYLLSAIVSKVTGKTLLEYLNEKVFGPLHVTTAAWQISPEGFNTGGWGLYVQPETMAKFGQLLLDKGRWNGHQLIPEAWVEAMMSKQIENGGQGYGYQMWMGKRPGSASADGAYGQYIIIMPDKELVVVVTECSVLGGGHHQRAIWELASKVKDEPLPASKAYQKAQRKWQSYELPAAQGQKKATALLPEKTYTLEKNNYDWAQLSFSQLKEGVLMTITHQDGHVTPVALGYKQWKTTTTDAFPAYSILALGRFKGVEGPFHIAGTYGWSKEGRLDIVLHYVDWITRLDMSVEFTEEGVVLHTIENHQDWTRFTIKGK